ncbi:MAG: PKD domain-containing protein, partial [Anaerolineales bacterium]|nr:PKD domain-containing protein [Anaerolineales bacterium]
TWLFGDGSAPLVTGGVDANHSVVNHIYPQIGVYTTVVTATNPLGEMWTSATVTITDMPVKGLQAANDSPTVVGDTTTLTATIDAGTNVTYTVNFGDGAAPIVAGELGDTQIIVTHAYPAVGLYTAIVTATNPMGYDHVTTLVTITDPPVEGLTATNDSPTLLGDSTTLTATITAGENVTFTWDLGDGSPLITKRVAARLLADGRGLAESTISHVYPSVGNFTAVVTASNTAGRASVSTMVVINDVPIGGLSASNDGPTALGDPTSISASINAGTNVSYTWNLGDGSPLVTSGGIDANHAMINHTYPAVGAFTVIVTASNSAGDAQDTTQVTVINQTITGLSALNDSPTLLGDTTTMTASIASGTNVSYTWDMGDGTPPFTLVNGLDSRSVVSHIYPSIGDFNVTVTASNSINEQHTTTTVTIHDVPISGLTASNNSPSVKGASTTLTATITSGSNVVYTWNFGDSSPPLVTSVSVVHHVYTTRGTYTATVSSRNTNNQQSATTRVTVTDIPVAGLSAINNSPTPIGGSTTLAATITAGSNVIFTWDFGDGSPLYQSGVGGSSSVVNHTYQAVGIYTTTVTASNTAGYVSDETYVSIYEVPIAGLVATNDGPTGVGKPTTLTALIAAGSNVIFTWTFGDGSPALVITGTQGNQCIVTHTYPGINIYTAQVVAKNSVSQAQSTTLVSVQEEAVSGLTAVNDSPTTLGDITTLTATISAGTNVSYIWSFGDGTPPVSVSGSSIDQSIISHTYTAVGEFTAVVTTTNPLGETSTATTVTINDIPIYGLVVDNDGPTEVDSNTTFSATVASGSNVVYTWNFGDGENGAGQVTTHSYSAPGIYTATVTATNGAGSSIATTQVTVYQVLTFLPGGDSHQTLDGILLIETPSAYTRTLIITYTPLVKPSYSTTNFLFAGIAFDLKAAYDDGTPVTTFNPPLSLTLYYDENKAETEANLELLRYDTQLSAWIKLSQSINTEANTITVSLEHLTEFALLEPTERNYMIFMPLIVRNSG